MRLSKQFPTRIVAVALGVAVFATASLGQQRAQSFGDFELHYNAVPTVMLEPEIARRYDVQRSQRRGLLTVSIRRAGLPVPASVTARSQNLAGQSQAIRMRQINEGDAVYYIGSYRATQEEELEFRITAQPKDSQAGPFELTFRHTFFGRE